MLEQNCNAMQFIIYITIFIHINCAKGDNDTNKNVTDDYSIMDLANTLITIFDVKAELNESKRIQELREKINIIGTYTIDKDKFEELLTNETSITDLNETNFYKSLSEVDHFRFLSQNHTKNLYLKLKEKMNRDDIMKIIAERGTGTKLVKTARRMMDDDFLDHSGEEVINEVVDKIIAEAPYDNHKYDAKDNESIYWDPQVELKEREEHQRLSGRRIFKGERTTVRHYPFMVSIHVMGRFWCGGAIYWHDLVLTTAACLQLMHNNRFYRENPKILEVRIGSNHSRIGGEKISALEVYFHPGYNPRNLQNNIAIIRIRRHLHFNYHRIPKIIQISYYSHSMPATAEILLLGWGVTKISQKLSYEPIFLQRKFLPIYPSTFCKEVYGDKFITETMFCAGTMSTGEGACDHDAGGPAILSGRLVGLISFGPATCGYKNAPTVFTLVGAYSDWIETINETMPRYYTGKKQTTTSTMSPMQEYFQTLKTSIRPKTTDMMTPVFNVPHVATQTIESPVETTTFLPEYGDETTPQSTTAKSLRQRDDTDGDEGWSIDLNK